ncbi:putative mediator of RNA polymerase II transcription subunit 19b isoform X2 [Silene latifolia]|uniref:putative mediator of RNA polymerase II transcription subunit 19b isoform X2 n=1 Tax=Silene latifolia TaxID=37657 RepID=UPI003D78A4BE
MDKRFVTDDEKLCLVVTIMSFKGAKFGFGPKELGGSVDLVNHYKLQSLHEFFCKRSLPMSVSETPYLQNVVGDREIRKGAGMELDQLSENLARPEDKKECVHPFRLDVLADVIHMQETATARLSSSTILLPTQPDRGTPTPMTKLENMSRDRHHKKNNGRHKRKIKDTKDQSHQNKGRDGNEVKDVKRDQPLMNGQDHMKRQEKRKHNGVDNPSRAQRHEQMR